MARRICSDRPRAAKPFSASVSGSSDSASGSSESGIRLVGSASGSVGVRLSGSGRSVAGKSGTCAATGSCRLRLSGAAAAACVVSENGKVSVKLVCAFRAAPASAHTGTRTVGARDAGISGNRAGKSRLGGPNCGATGREGRPGLCPGPAEDREAPGLRYFIRLAKSNGFQGPLGPWRVQGSALALPEPPPLRKRRRASLN